MPFASPRSCLAFLLLTSCSQFPIAGEYDRALRYRAKGDHAMAEWSFRRGAERNPTDFHCWNGLAEMLLHRSDFAGAEQAASRAIEISPTYGLAYWTRSLARSQRCGVDATQQQRLLLDLDGAVADMSKAQELGVERARIDRARIYALQRDFVRAFADVNAEIATRPSDPEPLGLRCIIHVLSGDEAAAAADREQLLRMKPPWLSALDRDLERARAARDS